MSVYTTDGLDENPRCVSWNVDNISICIYIYIDICKVLEANHMNEKENM